MTTPEKSLEPRCWHCGHLQADEITIEDGDQVPVKYCIPCGAGHGVHDFEPAPESLEEQGRCAQCGHEEHELGNCCELVDEVGPEGERYDEVCYCPSGLPAPSPEEPEETPGLSEARLLTTEQVADQIFAGEPWTFRAMVEFLTEREAAIAAEARRPLEERVTELEAWQKVAVTSNEEIAALTESDHGWPPAAVLALKNRAERSEAALRTIMGETHAPTMQLIAKRALASGGESEDGNGGH